MVAKKIKITDEHISAWTERAAEQLLAKWRPWQVLESLEQEGCTPKLANQILKNAQAMVRSENRADGRQMLVRGLLAFAAGSLLVLLAYGLAQALGLKHFYLPHMLGWMILGGLATAAWGVLKAVFGE